MSKLTAAYLAGLIDGEGSIEIRKIKNEHSNGGVYYRPRIRVAVVDKYIIQWLKDSFGGYIYVQRNSEKHNNWKDAYCWVVANQKLVGGILEKIYPYLRIKKESAIILKRFLKTFGKSSYKFINGESAIPQYQGLGYRVITKNALKTKEELYKALKLKNIKGKLWQSERLIEETPKKGSDSLNFTGIKTVR